MEFYKELSKKLVSINNTFFLPLESLLKIISDFRGTSFEDEIKDFNAARKGINGIVDVKLNQFDEYEEIKD